MTRDRGGRSGRSGSRICAIAAACAAAALALVSAPAAGAMPPFGNYAMNIEGRYDFHTWIWVLSPCANPGDCVSVTAIPQPIAKALHYRGEAPLAQGRYTLTIDDPYGLRCGNVYYGPTIPTHDVYTWDATTLAGSMQSSFDVGCDGAPGGTITYPFTLSRM